MAHYLVCDISNLLYRTFYANTQQDDTTIAGLAMHAALQTLNKYFRQFKPHKVVMAFDRNSWRKVYTASDECITNKPYKGNRRQNMTPKEKEKYAKFCKHLLDFETLITEHSTVIALAGNGLEADDLIAGFVQVHLLDPDNQLTVVSSDKDLIQLLGPENVRLIDPASGKDRTLEEWNFDPEYFLFEKCIRGDLGDNVQSACPRIRSTRIEKAYKDEYERTNLMKESWNGPDGTAYCVGDLYNENRLLMDLREQPEEIQKRMITTILARMKNPPAFNYFHFMKFLNRYDLKKIQENAEQFVQLLSR